MVTEGLLDYLDTRPIGLKDSVRLFATMHTAMGDAIISCWRLKYDVGFRGFRPSTPRTRTETRARPPIRPGCH